MEICVSPELVMDAALRGVPCEVVAADGTAFVLPISEWATPADGADTQLFLDRCTGPTLDVGCGPGRLVGALLDRDYPVMGIDVSAEAVRQTRQQGSPAVHGDVLSDSYDGDARLWQHIILADGNIGIGGNPVRLLRRLAQQLQSDGTVLVELDRSDTGLVTDQIQLRTKHQLSDPFVWARVGIDAIEAIATEAGLRLRDVLEVQGRTVAALVRLDIGQDGEK